MSLRCEGGASTLRMNGARLRMNAGAAAWGQVKDIGRSCAQLEVIGFCLKSLTAIHKNTCVTHHMY